jgi:hypothetical protein
MDIRYKFVTQEPHHRRASLYLQLMNALAEEGGKQGILHRLIPTGHVGPNPHRYAC